MASLDITSALDHTNINNRTAMQIVSSVLKTAKKDGQQVDLNEFVLSRDTIGRRRQENRDTISKQAKQEFLHNMSAEPALGWENFTRPQWRAEGDGGNHCLWRELPELRDMVTPDSWQLFKILKISPDWLALPPAEWDSNPDYMEFRNFVRQVKVINDCAERGVKLATDYSKSLTKDSQERSKIYQVVEAERRAKPDAKKATMNK